MAVPRLRAREYTLNKGTSMEIRITTLSENTANYGYLAEWGLLVNRHSGMSLSVILFAELNSGGFKVALQPHYG